MNTNVRRLWDIEINIQKAYFYEFLIIIIKWLDFIGFDRWCWSVFFKYSKSEKVNANNFNCSTDLKINEFSSDAPFVYTTHDGLFTHIVISTSTWQSLGSNYFWMSYSLQLMYDVCFACKSN